MTKTYFNNGDRVRYIGGIYTGIPVGIVGTVTDAEFPFVEFDGHRGDYPMGLDEIELVTAEEPKTPQFKVGDRVQGVEYSDRPNEFPPATIVCLKNSEADRRVGVEFDRDNGLLGHNLGGRLANFRGWYFHAEDLTLIKDAPKRPAFTRDLGLTPGTKVILLHLNKRGTISPMEALHSYSTMRLAPRIHELRKAGYNITTDIHEDESGHRYARYRLAA